MSQQLKDGFPTYVGFSANPSVKIWEKTVTPLGMDAGGENDTTTMRNTRYRTKQPKKLISMTDSSFTAAYDPAVYTQLVSMLGVNQQITVFFPDGDQLSFWGWLNEFKPNEITEGEQPTADCTIIASNQNNSSVEVAPVETLAASTTTTSSTTTTT